MTENEIWKDIVGYEGWYKVSNKGNVYSVERKDSLGRKTGGFMISSRRHTQGYLQADLRKDGIRKSKLIHRLVAQAFIPNPNGLPQINHKDEVKDNNNVENLEWCTSEYHLNFGTLKKRIGRKLSKRVKAVNVKTGKVITFNSTREAERKGYDSGAVSLACRGVYNTGGGNLYKGHRWFYEEGE